MRCESVRGHLLTADRTELLGEGDSPVPRHLRSCPECRRAADRILEMEGELGAAVGALAGERAGAEVGGWAEPRSADRPRVEAGAPEAVGASRRTTTGASSAEGRLRRRVRSVPWRVVAPVAAAAVIVLMLLLPDSDEPAGFGPAGGAGSTVRSAGPPEVHVEASASERLVVFQPRHPSITVVWFFGGDENSSPETERN